MASTTTSVKASGNLTGKELRDAWFQRIEEYRKEYPELAEELYRMQHRQLPEGWDHDLARIPH